MAQLSLAWLLEKPGVITIVGARTLDQLQDNLAVEPGLLTQEDLDLLDTASAPAPSWLREFIDRFASDNDRHRTS